MAPEIPAPLRIVGIVDSYSRELDKLEARSTRNIRAILRRSLAQVLGSLRYSYRQYTNALGAQGRDPAGNRIRRPGEYGILDSSARLGQIYSDAAGFLSESEISQWQALHQRDLAEAAALGGRLGQELADLADRPPGGVFQFAAADPAVLRAAALRTGAYIRGEGVKFRDDLVRIVGTGAARGLGPRQLEADIRKLLRGARDPKGLNRRLGLEQRAALVATSELSNVYAQATLARAQQRGDNYVRVLASNDERVCPVCASRNSRVFPADRVTLPFHPKCRCVAVPVPNEAVQERDLSVRGILLDSERWRAEHERGVEAYAKAKGLDMEKARADLAKALRTPTPAEKRLFPKNPLPLVESVPLFD
jgi:SPP1 gp7 family putative phage head morphogenesis protein